MIVSTAEITGFRSINDININLARINLFIGKNSTGKSNILLALDLCARIDKKKLELLPEDFHPEAKAISCTFQLQITRKDWENLVGNLDLTKHKTSSSIRDFVRRYHYPTLRYKVLVSKSDPQHPSFLLSYKKTKKWHQLFGHHTIGPIDQQVLNRFQELLDKHYYLISLRDSFSSMDESTHSRIAEKIMAEFTSGDPKVRGNYNKLRDALTYITEGIGGEIQPAKFEVARGQDKFRLRYEVEKKHLLPVTHSGDGAQRVALILYYLINKPYGLIAIEEPEFCLHAGAQRRFRRVLDQFCDQYQKQLIVSTHSPIFLEGWNSASLYRVDIPKGTTIVKHVNEREQVISLAAELGIHPSDAFMANGIIWVEGPSDIQIYKVLLSKIGIDIEEKNVLIMCGGGDTMQHIKAEDLHRINRNFALLLDSDKVDSKKQAAKWKRDLIENCKQLGIYGYITRKREIENYFSKRAIYWHYKPANFKMPEIGDYEDFNLYIKNNILGRTYVKTRDGAEIARLMSRQFIESSGDLYDALRELQNCISRWTKTGS